MRKDVEEKDVIIVLELLQALFECNRSYCKEDRQGKAQKLRNSDMKQKMKKMSTQKVRKMLITNEALCCVVEPGSKRC